MGVRNPEIICRSEALPEHMRDRLREPGYVPHVTELLVKGLPVAYGEGGLAVESPDGRRIRLERHDVLDDNGIFRRFRFETVETLTPAVR